MKPSIETQTLLTEAARDLQLTLVAGATGTARRIDHMRIQKPGLALAGFTDFVHPGRIQIFGATELAYLAQLESAERTEAVRHLLACDVAGVIATKGMLISPDVVTACDTTHTPLFTTPQVTSVFVSRMEAWLEERLAPSTVIHAVLLGVFGVGVLILGKSGIGKSECALDLIRGGHRLIADDIVRVRRRGPETVYGSGEALFKHHIEIRGLGILNVRDLYGVAAVMERKRVDLVVELVSWDEDEEYDRLGLDERRFSLLGVELPLLTVPVRPGRNMSAIVEVAARNHLLKAMGKNTADDLQKRLATELAPGRRERTDDID